MQNMREIKESKSASSAVGLQSKLRAAIARFMCSLGCLLRIFQNPNAIHESTYQQAQLKNWIKNGFSNIFRNSIRNWILFLIVPILFAACATRPLPGRDWESSIDLHFTYDSFTNVNLDLSCQSRSSSGVITVTKAPLCKIVALDLASHGAITAEERARAAREALDESPTDEKHDETKSLLQPPTQITLELTANPTLSEGCGLLAAFTAFSFGLIPCSSLRTTPIDLKVFDKQGVAVESHRILQTERRIYGSTALLTLIDGKGRREHRESQRRMIHFIENRVYAATLRSHVRQAGPPSTATNSTDAP